MNYKVTFTTEERGELLDVIHGPDYICAIEEYKRQLRQLWKHSEDDVVAERAIWARDLLDKILDDYNLEVF